MQGLSPFHRRNWGFEKVSPQWAKNWNLRQTILIPKPNHLDFKCEFPVLCTRIILEDLVRLQDLRHQCPEYLRVRLGIWIFDKLSREGCCSQVLTLTLALGDQCLGSHSLRFCTSIPSALAWTAVSEYHRLGGLEAKETCASQFWLLEVQDQGARRPVCGKGLLLSS